MHISMLTWIVTAAMPMISSGTWTTCQWGQIIPWLRMSGPKTARHTTIIQLCTTMAHFARNRARNPPLPTRESQTSPLSQTAIDSPVWTCYKSTWNTLVTPSTHPSSPCTSAPHQPRRIVLNSTGNTDATGGMIVTMDPTSAIATYGLAKRKNSSKWRRSRPMVSMLLIFTWAWRHVTLYIFISNIIKPGS